MKALLVSTGKHGLGRKYPIVLPCIMGRHQDCVQLVDEKISKRHASIRKTGKGFEVEDLHSLNGVFVNGKRVTGKYPLVANDVLSLGEQEFLFNPTVEILPVDDGSRAVFLLEDQTQPQGMSFADEDQDQEDPVKMPMGFFEKSMSALASDKDPLAAILKVLNDWIGFDSAAVLAVRRGKVAEVLAIQSRTRTLSFSKSISQWTIANSRAIKISDAMSDMDFKGGKSIVSSRLRSVLAAPLRLEGKTSGVVFLSANRSDFFSGKDLKLISAVAPVFAAALALTKNNARATIEAEAISVHRQDQCLSSAIARPAKNSEPTLKKSHLPRPVY